MSNRYPEFDMSTEEAFGKLLQILIRQAEAAKGTPGGKFERILDAEVLAFKIIHHAISCLALYRGVKLSELAPHPAYRDGFSVLGLARMCHESLLLFDYLFVTPQSEEEAEFRYLAWWYADAAKQARFPAEAEEHQARKQELQALAKEVQTNLEATNFFQSMPQSDRKKLMQNLKWPILGWADLGRQAGFNEQHSVHYYKYLCSYAHPGNLSVRQMRFAAGTKMQRHLMETGLKHTAVMLACLAQDFPRAFSKAWHAIEENSLDARLVQLWSGYGRNDY